MTRLIDADKLHDDLRAKQKWIVKRGDKHNEGYTYDQVHFAIDDQPTVEAVQWIPVSERLPENEKWVVVSFHRPHEIDPEDGYEYDERQWTGVGSYFKKCGFFQAMDEIGETGDEVIAWMPFPEPYKAERKEE